MEKTFASAKLSRDPQARGLIEYLVEREPELAIQDGVLYYEFPLFRDTNDELHRANVLLASTSHGVVIFGLVPEGQVLQNAILEGDERLSQLESVVFGKCLQSKRLRRSQRELVFPLKSILLASAAVRAETENSLVTSLNSIAAELESIRLANVLDEAAWKELRATLEGTKAIIRPRPREVPERFQRDPESKVAILAELESEIANFDADQRRAAISVVDGPQRIRGLAGTGKTIVLAMKAAHIHLADPTLDILVTFYTKSLYDFIRRLITRFYRQFNDRDPDWNRVHVRHAWGGRYREGVYYNACMENDVEPRKLGSVMGRDDPFEVVCSELLREGPLKQAYDYVLMDEAQDFPPSFYRLCFHLTRGGAFDRNVIWAYDELQNIMNVRVPGATELFGGNADGVPLMDLERASQASQQVTNHDIVLYKSYRNPREVLVCAHALGFGIYSDQMVQTLENRAHWEDLGYEVEQGDFRVGRATFGWAARS